MLNTLCEKGLIADEADDDGYIWISSWNGNVFILLFNLLLGITPNRYGGTSKVILKPTLKDPWISNIADLLILRMSRRNFYFITNIRQNVILKETTVQNLNRHHFVVFDLYCQTESVFSLTDWISDATFVDRDPRTFVDVLAYLRNDPQPDYFSASMQRELRYFALSRTMEPATTPRPV